LFRSVWLAVSGQEEFGGPSAWTSRTVRVALVARGPSEDRARTIRYSRCVTGGSAFFFGPSVRDPRTVRPYHTDRPPDHHGLSAWCLTELLSSLLLLVSLSLWDRLGFAPRVGRCVVTTRLWQTRVGILGCEFGA
jgi:hypothetical protein